MILSDTFICRTAFMHAILMKSGRGRIGVSPEELSDAAATKKLLISWKYLAAGLKYVKDDVIFILLRHLWMAGNVVYHHVQAAMFPDWIDDLTRTFVFDEDRLTLSARDDAGNVMDLVWERVSIMM